MATDGPTPKPCNHKVYRHGQAVLMTANITSNRLETYVQTIARESKQPVDWHFCGGRAVVLALGDFDAVQRAIDNHLPLLDQLYRECSSELFGSPLQQKAQVVRYYPVTPPSLWGRFLQWLLQFGMQPS